MKAVVCRRYGPPEILQIVDIEKPSPKSDEILIQTRVMTVTAGDCRVRSLRLPAGMGLIGRLAIGLTGPRQPILGSELSGVVVAVGSGVTKFKVGDEVFAFTGVKLGCHSEFKCLSESAGVAIKPAALSFDEAAAISTGGTTALAFLKKTNLQKGARVAVVGASGSVGNAAVQLAKHFGARVTGVTSTANLELLKDLGADQVLDYTKEDFTKTGEVYDIILDAVGAGSIDRYLPVLEANGCLLLVSSGLADVLKAPAVARKGKQKVVAGPATWHPEDLRFLATLAEAGEFKPIIDRKFAWSQIQDAHRYVDTGRKKGNVLVTCPADTGD